jgi:uncharacterized protein YlbG (UPF0298 family)
LEKENTLDTTNRMQYVIHYKGGQVVKKLETLPVNIAYTSKKMSYVIVYADQDYESRLFKALKFTKGFKHFSASLTFDKNLNF